MSLHSASAGMPTLPFGVSEKAKSSKGNRQALNFKMAVRAGDDVILSDDGH